MPVNLYYTNGSGPCRFVALVAAALKVPLNLKHIDLMAGEQMHPEFVKINPQHSVPTLVDDGFVLWESRAICRYLVYKYGNDSSLYPKDPKTRATVDQRLDFDLGTFYPSLGEYFYAQVFNGVPEDPQKLVKLEEVLEILNTCLEDSKFAAGEELSLADLCLVTTVSTIDAIGISLAKYPNIERWFELVKKIAPDYEEANGKGAELNKQMAAKLRSK